MPSQARQVSDLLNRDNHVTEAAPARWRRACLPSPGGRRRRHEYSRSLPISGRKGRKEEGEFSASKEGRGKEEKAHPSHNVRKTEKGAHDSNRIHAAETSGLINVGNASQVREGSVKRPQSGWWKWRHWSTLGCWWSGTNRHTPGKERKKERKTNTKISRNGSDQDQKKKTRHEIFTVCVWLAWREGQGKVRLGLGSLLRMERECAAGVTLRQGEVKHRHQSSKGLCGDEHKGWRRARERARERKRKQVLTMPERHLATPRSSLSILGIQEGEAGSPRPRKCLLKPPRKGKKRKRKRKESKQRCWSRKKKKKKKKKKKRLTVRWACSPASPVKH